MSYLKLPAAWSIPETGFSAVVTSVSVSVIWDILGFSGSGVRELLLDPVVAPGLELERERLVAALDDAPVDHDVHKVGYDVAEEALVVGDEEDPEARPAQVVDPVGDDPQRVDVQAGIRLVHEGEAGLQHRHLKDLGALLLAAGEPLVAGARRELPVDLRKEIG